MYCFTQWTLTYSQGKIKQCILYVSYYTLCAVQTQTAMTSDSDSDGDSSTQASTRTINKCYEQFR